MASSSISTNVEVLPKPLQQPHPPVWMAATSESAIDWAASRGFSILMDPHCTCADLAAKRAPLRRADGGGRPSPPPVATSRWRGCSPLRSAEQRAEAIARRGAEWTVGSYIGGQHRPAHQAPSAATADDPVQRYVDEVILHGTPKSMRRPDPGPAGDRPAELPARRPAQPDCPSTCSPRRCCRSWPPDHLRQRRPVRPPAASGRRAPASGRAGPRRRPCRRGAGGRS